jgi:hypothetical protein
MRECMGFSDDEDEDEKKTFQDSSDEEDSNKNRYGSDSDGSYDSSDEDRKSSRNKHINTRKHVTNPVGRHQQNMSKTLEKPIQRIVDLKRKFPDKHYLIKTENKTGKQFFISPEYSPNRREFTVKPSEYFTILFPLDKMHRVQNSGEIDNIIFHLPVALSPARTSATISIVVTFIYLRNDAPDIIGKILRYQDTYADAQRPIPTLDQRNVKLGRVHRERL